jgi:hypothetical protein
MQAPVILDAWGLGGQTLAQGLYDLDRGLLIREEEQARAYTAAEASRARLGWTAKMLDAQANAGPGAPEFTRNMLTEYDEYAKMAIEKAPTRTAKKMMAGQLGSLRLSIGETSLQFEAKARIDHLEDQYKTAVDNSAKLMNTVPDAYGPVLEDLMQSIDASSLPPIRKSALKDKAKEDLSVAAVWSQLQKSPTEFLTSIGILSDGRQRVAPKLEGGTGNAAFDNLSFDKRVKVVEQAFRTKAQIDSDAEKAARAKREELSEDGMKTAWDLDAKGQLTMNYIEILRPIVSAGQYHSLLEAYNQTQSGERKRDDPATYRYLQQLLNGKKPGEAEMALSEAFKAHRNGLIKNETLNSVTNEARSIMRAEQPLTPYERGKSYIRDAMDPGMVPDPLGRQRMADAIDEFNKWYNAEKRTPEDTEKRYREIVNQYKLAGLGDTVLGLPQPRFSPVTRQTGDPNKMLHELAIATDATAKRLASKQISQADYEIEMNNIARWLRAAQEAQKYGGQRK